MKPDRTTTKPAARKPIADWLKTLLILAVASLLCEGLYLLNVGAQNISIIMMLAVFMIAATTTGYWYGLAASLAGVLIYDYLVTEPRFGFSITLGFPITLSIMLLVALVTSSIVTRIKRQTQNALEKEQRAELLYDINRKMLSCRDESSIARYAIEYLKKDLHASVALFTDFSATDAASFYFRGAEGDVASEFFSTPPEQAAARLAARRMEAMGPGGQPLSDVHGYYCPAIAQGEVYAVFGISCQAGPLPESKGEFLRLIVEQTAQALRVQSLTRQQQEAQVAAETEKSRNSFLRGISHDLRTPLTSIIGASDTSLENRQSLSPATQVQLIQGIQADSQWLLRMVENILSVTRIHQNDMAIDKVEDVAEEVVGEAVSVFRKRHPDAEITIVQPEDVLLVPMDSLLITQVLNNLLDNAHRHSAGRPVQVRVEMGRKNGFAQFSVTDKGPGIPADNLSSLFEIRPATPGCSEDASRGLGIGLSICKTIIQVHGGWIDARNLPGGGACFTFALPMDEEVPHGE